jgi:hypothetical protein
VAAGRPKRRDGFEPDLARPFIEPGGPLERLFPSERDGTRWSRLTIKLRTHPLHRFPRVTQKDLLLPNRQDPFRLAGDCLVIGALFSLLAFFPIELVALAVTSDLGAWMAGAMAAVGLLTALYVFARAWSPDTRDLDRF